MRKKKADKLIDALGQLFIALVFIAFVMYYFSDKTRFWIVIAIGFFLLLLAAATIVAFQRRRFRDILNWHSDREMLSKLKNLHPQEFESFISDLFGKLGYKTETVGGRNDGGVDVVAIKDGKKHFIQCKRFSNKQVSVGNVRDFYGALADNLSDAKGYFITTNKFTLEAERFAEDKPIELIDGHRLLEYIHQANVEEMTKKRICPDCGSELVLRHGKYGDFYGCSSFPKCKYTEKYS